MKIQKKHVKKAVTIVAAVSVSYAVGRIVRNNVDATNTMQKVEVVVASFVLAKIVSDHAEKYAADAFDAIDEKIQEAGNKTNT